MDNIISMSKKTGDAGMSSPREVLEDALIEVEKKESGAFKDCQKLLVLALDDNDQYVVSFIQAGMKMSQCVALCEVAKTIFLTEMNYIPAEND